MGAVPGGAEGLAVTAGFGLVLLLLSGLFAAQKAETSAA